MGCGCKHGDEFQFDPHDVRTVGTLKVNLPALRRVLGGRPEILLAMEALSFRPKTNDARMWRHFTTSVYQSGDLPWLATREALQNSVDAIRAAVRRRKLRAGEGRFSVTWDEERRSLTWEDNGIGMDPATVATKFLSLGETGKEDAEDSAEAAGGFGVAKAVILGVSPTFRYELHSLDKKYVSEGFDKPPQAPLDAPFHAGTRLTVFDIPAKFDDYTGPTRAREPIMDRLRNLLAFSDLPEITLVLNDLRVQPFFSGRRGEAIATGGSWGQGVTCRVRGYRRGVGDMRGSFYVRLNGLFQFVAWSKGLPSDVVLDLTTTVRPGAQGYPLNAARDGFQDAAQYQFWRLREELEREALSVARAAEYETIDPEDDDAEGEALADSTLAAFGDADFRRAMDEAAGGLADFLKAEGRLAKSELPHEQESDAPAGPPKAPNPIPGLSRPPKDAADMLQQALREADKAAGGTVLDEAAEQALSQLAAGSPLSALEAQSLAKAADRATEAAVEPGGGGLMQVARVEQAVSAVQKITPLPIPPRSRNPFGKFAGLLIAKKKYNPRRAGAFKRNWAKWIPYLTVWDAILRLMAAEADIGLRFKPGFVLEDGVVGMCAPGRNGGIVYVHPDRFKEYATAHAERPMALASFLHQLAAHELAHLKAGGGEGHSEVFSSTREALGRSTAHLVPAFAVLCASVLKLPVKDTPDQKQVRDLRKQLERAGGGKDEVKRLCRELAAAEEARDVAVAEAATVGHRVATLSCPDCVRRLEGFLEQFRRSLPPGVDHRRVERFIARRRVKIAELVEAHDRGLL